MTEATQRPWDLEIGATKSYDLIYSGSRMDGVTIARVPWTGKSEDRANADLIVKAVNSHDALVAVRDAAKAYYDFTRSPEPQGFNNQYNMRAIRVGEALFAALEAAK